MALPANGSQWPLPQAKTARDSYREARAWYSGDEKSLRSLYGGDRDGSSVQNGIRGWLSRMFWGRPESRSQVQQKLHVPVAADLAAVSADLLVGEAPSCKVIGDNAEAVQGRLDYLLTVNRFGSRAQEVLEEAAAVGDGWARVTWSEKAGQHALLTFVPAERVIPTFEWGALTEALIETVHRGPRDTRFVHYERHIPGRVEHALYQVFDDELHIVPLDTIPATAGLSVDEFGGVETGFPGMAVVHIPNVKPNRKGGDDPVAKHLGRADTAGLETLMDALDEAYTSLMRDLRLGKGRVMVPQSLLESNGPGKGAIFDAEREVFVGVNSPDAGDDLSKSIQSTQFAIRVDEHLALIDDLLKQILRGAGYGPQTFGMHDGGTGTTATETHSRDRRTRGTREKKSRYVQEAFSEALTALLAIDAAKFPDKGSRALPVVVEVAPEATPTMAELGQTLDLITRAQAASIETRVRLLHPDWDDEAVANEVAAIKDEQGIGVTDVGLLPE